MPTTAYDYFTTATQASTGSNQHIWNNPDNILAPANFADSLFNNGFDTYTITGLDPKSGLAVPPSNIIITNISVRISADRTGGNISTGTAAIDGQIGSGLVKATTNLNNASPADRILSGGLAYWGISNADALDFAAGGANRFKFYARITGSTISFSVRVYAVEVQFTYVSTLVAPAVLF